MDTMERRVLPDVELRVEGDDETGRRLVGVSPIYNRESQPLWGAPDGGDFREVVVPGAVTRSLNEGREVKARVEHQGGLLLIGSTRSGTLRLEDTEDGVRWEADLPDTSAARDVAALVARGDMRGSSFAFRLRGEAGERWRQDDEGWVRELVDIHLIDVAPTDSPAYVDATVAMRSLERQKERKRSEGHRARARIRELEMRERALRGS